MTDIVDRLRDRAYSLKAKDRLCEEAAAEIDRLRQLLTTEGCVILTYEEWKALEWYGGYGAGDHAAILQRLLERLPNGALESCEKDAFPSSRIWNSAQHPPD